MSSEQPWPSEPYPPQGQYGHDDPYGRQDYGQEGYGWYGDHDAPYAGYQDAQYQGYQEVQQYYGQQDYGQPDGQPEYGGQQQYAQQDPEPGYPQGYEYPSTQPPQQQPYGDYSAYSAHSEYNPYGGYSDDPVPGNDSDHGHDDDHAPDEGEFPDPGLGGRAGRPGHTSRSRRLVAAAVGVVVLGGAVAAYTLIGGSKPVGTAGTSAVVTAGGGSAASPGSAASGHASASPTPSPAPTPAASVTIPATAGGLTQMTNSVGKSVVAAMQKADADNADLAHAQWAAYEKSGSTTFLGDLTLVQLSKAADLQLLYRTTGAAATAQTAGSSLLSQAETVKTTIPGSAMVCGLSTGEKATLRMCVWVDASEFALFGGNKSLSNDQAAAYALALESASEGS